MVLQVGSSNIFFACGVSRKQKIHTGKQNSPVGFGTRLGMHTLKLRQAFLDIALSTCTPFFCLVSFITHTNLKCPGPHQMFLSSLNQNASLYCKIQLALYNGTAFYMNTMNPLTLIYKTLPLMKK